MGKEINLNLKKAVEIGGKITKLENGFYKSMFRDCNGTL
jgi:hypothetical protein